MSANMPASFNHVLLLPHLQVRNANAVSSPMTWGFPPPSAFTGFAHALERKLRAQGAVLSVVGVAVVAHRFEPQVTQPAGRYHKVFNLTRNPSDKDGNPSAIVEEGRAHLELSLVLALSCDGFVDTTTGEQLAQQAYNLVLGMRLAGGSVMPPLATEPAHRAAQWLKWPDRDEQAQAWRQLRKQLLPGFALVSREGLLSQHLDLLRGTAENAHALDALLDLCRINMQPVDAQPSEDDASDKKTPAVEWRNKRPYRGWLVPLPVGYAAVSPLQKAGRVKAARDASLPLCFVESVLSLGEWINPLRLKTLEQALWWHDAQPQNGLYRLRNGYESPPTHVN